jgi:hypothetical protein
MEKNYFQALNEINVNGKTEKKNGLTYLSWAWAWGEVKKCHPDATYAIYENAAGWNYHTDGRTAWVKTGVTVNGIEHIEYLPVMDHRNRSIPLDNINSFDVNKAIQRSLTKAVARHGLGLYIYAGEDLPENNDSAEDIPVESNRNHRICEGCGHILTPFMGLDKKPHSVDELVELSRGSFNRVLCYDCVKAESKKKKENTNA